MNKSFVVKTPGSCGEIIQGFYGQEEMLISYPVNIYSEVAFKYKPEYLEPIGRKSQQAVAKFFKETEVDPTPFESYAITIKNDIPIGKGMASSTADIAGIFIGLYHLYNIPITEAKLAQLCCAIEPTDSTIFEKMTLFDHINGKVIESYHWEINCDVLVLEPEYQINTTDFRQAKKEQLSKKNHSSKALDIFKKAVEKKSIHLLCDATYLSALENQEVLEKPYLKEIYTIVKALGCYGINVAHSGSVIAILFNQIEVDVDMVMNALEESQCLNYYKKKYMAKMVPGGSIILED